ncbi:MAG: preprotein translocase subunit SecG [Pseudomonadota bacterium]|mgnify:FL=1
MENVVLIIHLILALGLVAVVLMQRSEGGGLGMGGGGGAATGRAPATAMGKVTWVLAIAFIITSITLTILAARNASGTSVIDQLGITPPAQNVPSDDLLPPAGDLVPPAPGDSGPLVPSAD